MLHSFIKQANGTLPANIYDAFPFNASLAWDTYALDEDTGTTYVTVQVGKPIANVRSKETAGQENIVLRSVVIMPTNCS